MMIVETNEKDVHHHDPRVARIARAAQAAKASGRKSRVVVWVGLLTGPRVEVQVRRFGVWFVVASDFGPGLYEHFAGYRLAHI